MDPAKGAQPSSDTTTSPAGQHIMQLQGPGWAGPTDAPHTPAVDVTATAVARLRLSGTAAAAAPGSVAGAASRRGHQRAAAAAAPAGADDGQHSPFRSRPLAAVAAATPAAPRRAGLRPQLAKHGSDIGLAGVAEAAGYGLTELAPALSWRQDVLMVRLVAGLVLGLTACYALLLAPARLGWRADLQLVTHFCSQNALAFVLFNLLGVYPALLACIAWPSLRSYRHKVPLWRYLAASFGAGVFALLAYLANWDPPRITPRLPPHKLTGRAVWLQRLYEGRLLPAVLLASTLYLYIFCYVASAATWAQFGYLVSHSRTIHVMLLDCTLLTLLTPWLVVADATARSWGPVKTQAGRVLLGFSMVAVPVIGPAIYLLLRPVSKAGSGWGLPAMGLRFWGLRGRGAAGRALRPRRPAAAAPADAAQHGRLNGQAAGRGRRDAAVRLVGDNVARNGPLTPEVAAAAMVPLPTPFQTTLGAAGAMVAGWWNAGWMWLGQIAARMRGGGPPVASQDEVAGDELDVDGRDGGVSATHHLAFSSFLTHFRPQQPNQLGPGTKPIKARAPDGAIELLFSNDYDEYEFDFDRVSSDEEFDQNFDQEFDSDDEGEEGEDEEAGFDQGFDHEFGSEDDETDEVMDEEDDELFEDEVHSEDAVAGAADVAAAPRPSHSDDDEEGEFVREGVGAHRHGTRPAKEAALKMLAELGQQEHPKLAAHAHQR